MADTSVEGVSIVTQPARAETEKMHAEALADIIAEITSVTVLTANLSDDSSLRRHDVVEYTSKGAGTNVVVAALRFVLNQFRICRHLVARDDDVVLFFGTTAYLLPIVFARLLGKTVIVEPRGDVPLTLRLHWETQIPSPVARFLAGSVRLFEHLAYRVADAIVVYTPSMADQLGLERYESKLHTEGARYVDTDRFGPTTPYREREDLVGFVGRLDEEKGIRDLAVVARETDARFVFVGDGNDRSWLEEELAEEIAAGQVEITGWVEYDDVPQQMNRLRLLLLRSDPTEGLPTVILEAFGCGTPVYANAVAGVPDVVRDGETGFLMDDESPEEAADRIDAVLAGRDMETMSDRCRTLVVDRYSFDAAVERYTAILDAVSSD